MAVAQKMTPELVDLMLGTLRNELLTAGEVMVRVDAGAIKYDGDPSGYAIYRPNNTKTITIEINGGRKNETSAGAPPATDVTTQPVPGSSVA